MSTRRKQTKPNRHPDDDDDSDPTHGHPVRANMSPVGVTMDQDNIEEAEGILERVGEDVIKTSKDDAECKTKTMETKTTVDDTMISEDEEDVGGLDCDDDLNEENESPTDEEPKIADEIKAELEPQVRRYEEDVDEPPAEDPDEAGLKLRSREGSADKEDSDGSTELEKESLTAALQNLMVDFHWPEGTSITIERVESTKVAVAELTAAAIQSSTSDYSSASLQDLALIQSTLFTLQQQQIVQLQLIQQLLAQLAMCTGGELDPSILQECSSEPGSPTPARESESERTPATAKPNRSKPDVPKSTPEKPSTASSSGESLSLKFASLLNCGNQDPNRPLSPGLAAQSSLNAILMPDSDHDCSSGVNTLEMLQKRTQEVLDSASQGLLASSLVDENYKQTGVMDKREPFFKHRCRYCGKVFGSDSALQIHIRSHTGERPYKCNVCGSRFTTKGNLKVHFQRHAAKFPHVKMNPHPVPEHLDHFHPPLLASGERSPDIIPTNLPFGPGPPPAFQGVNFMRFDGATAAAAAAAAAKLSLGLTMPEPSVLEPEDLSKAKPKTRKPTPPEVEMESAAKSEAPARFDEDDDDDDEIGDEEPEDIEMAEEKPPRDQPENLSSKSLPLMQSIPLQASPRAAARPTSASKSGKHSRRDSMSPHSSKDGSSEKADDPALMDPRAYAALLPRPGSASSAWESLIEVNTSSETSKLQQLVDNIDNQTTDPNECVVCHRVLSCKSALQMHYRTHTGERPFKCRLCGRAFTTKGNLKTHMGVHRIKEGDAYHQCPVCHKRFTTQLVLQQHIRLHTGEPTELTFDQIRAGEIRDFIPNFPPTSSSGGGVGVSPFLSPAKDSRDATTPGSHHSGSASASSSTPAPPPLSLFPEDLSKKITSGPPSSTPSILNPPPSSSRNSAMSPATTDSELSSSDWGKHSESGGDTRTTPPSAGNPLGPTPFLPLDLTPKNSIFSPFLPMNPLMGNSALSSLANSVLNSTAGFNPVHMRLIAGRGATRGNTTCGLCFKTFACNSALEIHYRSHTKERPFKCTICDRGFSTKGNMKQHMLTHKIRDMPANVFDGSKIHSQNSNSSCSSSSVTPQKPTESDQPKQEKAPVEPEDQEGPRRSRKIISEDDDDSRPPAGHHQPHHQHHHHHSQQQQSHYDDENSRSSSTGGTSNIKHLCHVCQKGFSSSSSLQIHMRTHTGDKPFKCSVCQKAFTTKGNLKVHMGTHMWTSGASRRGRRMSLELPLGLQFQPPPQPGNGDRGDGRNNHFFFPALPPNFPGGPMNLAGSKLVDYSLLRPPLQFPGGILPPSLGGPHICATVSGSKDEKDERDAAGDDDDDDGASDT